MTKEKDNKTIIYGSTVEHIEHMLAQQHQLQEALIEATHKRRVNILIENLESEKPLLYVITNRAGDKILLANVAYTVAPINRQTDKTNIDAQLPTVCEIESLSDPPWLLINESQMESELDQHTQIGKYVHQFLEQFVPQTGEIPVWTFNSIQEFQRNLPIARIKYTGSLLTVNTSSTRQPELFD